MHLDRYLQLVILLILISSSLITVVDSWSTTIFSTRGVPSRTEPLLRFVHKRTSTTLKMSSFTSSTSPLVSEKKFKKPIVAVDIDEVLALFIPTLADFHNEHYGKGQTTLTAESFVSYEFHNVWGGSKEECSDIMDHFFDSDHFKSRVNPVPKAFEVLSELKQTYDLHIVTARQHKVEDLTRAWIAQYFPNTFTEIHFGNHYSRSGKSRTKAEMCKEIGATLLIDDSLVYATQVSREGIHVLLFGDYAWNRLVTLQKQENVEMIFSPHSKDEVSIQLYSEEAFDREHGDGFHQSTRAVVYRVHDWEMVRSAVRRMIKAHEIEVESLQEVKVDEMRAAVVQMCSVNDKQKNLQQITATIEKICTDHPDTALVCLPECCIFMGNTMEETVDASEDISETSASIAALGSVAKKHHVWISVGGFPETRFVNNQGVQGKLMSNTHFLINRDGLLQTPVYRKIHLFDCPFVKLQESRMTVPGNEVVVMDVEGWKIGLAVCYDLRFSGLFEAMKEVDAILLPAAFTVPTGTAHWEVLLRSRAIEKQCYVLAAAQSGQHNEKRISYGHSMIVDPWGKIQSQLQDEAEGFCLVTLKKALIEETRLKMPLQQHQRKDVYSL